MGSSRLIQHPASSSDSRSATSASDSPGSTIPAMSSSIQGLSSLRIAPTRNCSMSTTCLTRDPRAKPPRRHTFETARRKRGDQPPSNSRCRRVSVSTAKYLKTGFAISDFYVLSAEAGMVCTQNRRSVYQLTGASCFATWSATSRIKANIAIRTTTPLSLWRKIARLGLSLRSMSSSRAPSRESLGQGPMTVLACSSHKRSDSVGIGLIQVGLLTAGEAFFLNTGAIHNIDVGNALLQRIRLQHLVSCLAQTINHFSGHLERLG